jgi:hypothetical protein
MVWPMQRLRMAVQLVRGFRRQMNSDRTGRFFQCLSRCS